MVRYTSRAVLRLVIFANDVKLEICREMNMKVPFVLVICIWGGEGNKRTIINEHIDRHPGIDTTVFKPVHKSRALLDSPTSRCCHAILVPPLSSQQP